MLCQPFGQGPWAAAQIPKETPELSLPQPSVGWAVTFGSESPTFALIFFLGERKWPVGSSLSPKRINQYLCPDSRFGVRGFERCFCSQFIQVLNPTRQNPWLVVLLSGFLFKGLTDYCLYHDLE